MPNASDAAPRPGPAASLKSPRKWLPLAAVGLLIVAILVFPGLAPNPYILSTGVIVLNWAVLATSWNFVGGFTGYISLGHGALAGLGGYATGLLVAKAGVPSFVALVIAAVLVGALAIPIGFAALRVRGASFVIVSIALVLILLLVFQSWASFTGGSRGLVVPRPFPDLSRPEHHRVFWFLFSLFPIFWMLMLALKNAEEQTTTYFSFSPTWSAVPACLRSPCGPSVTITEGMPSRSIPWVRQKSAPSSRVVWTSSGTPSTTTSSPPA